MVPQFGSRTMIGGGGRGNEGPIENGFERAIGVALREQQRKQEIDSRERELNLCRSGSAPPTVEGSLNAVGGLFETGNGLVISEEEQRSDPAYLSYYYSHVNLNPRLPPPLLSKEDWRFAQRLQSGTSGVGGIGDRRKVSKPEANGPGRSMYSMPPGFAGKKEEEMESDRALSSADWSQDGLIGLGSKQKSFAEIFQDDLSSSNPNSRHPSRPVSRNAFEENVANALNNVEAELANLRRDNGNIQGSSKIRNVGASYSYAAALNTSLSRSTTPDPQHVPRLPSPCPTPIGGGRTGASERRTIASQNSFNGVASGMNESADLVASLAGMNLSTNAGGDDENPFHSNTDQDTGDHHNYHFNVQANQDSFMHPYDRKSEPSHQHMAAIPQQTGRSNFGGSEHRNFQVERPKPSLSSGKSFSKGSYASTTNGGLSPHYGPLDGNNSTYSNYGSGGYSMSSPLSPMMASQLNNMNLPPLLEKAAAASSMGIGIDSMRMGTGSESLNSSRINNQMAGNVHQGGFVDPMYLQYLRTAEYAAQLAGHGDHSPDRGYSNMYMDSLQKAYIGSLVSSQKSQYGAALGNKSSGSNHGYHGNDAFGIGMGFHGSPLASPVIPNASVGHGSSIRHNDFNMRYPAGARNMGGGGVMGSWPMDGGFGSSMLEEFKSNKTKSFELAEIAGHVVEFSSDQYGSRFIQQKLETASTEEKNMVFEEIIPQALPLMTDVFGNYVIQKFFEHGMPNQRRELAGKLDGQVLTLSLQMYGCRVIQKAIEVVDLDQKIEMVKELDGHIMRCVRDQNGNHVIQKCIECVPEESIQFIIQSFFGQVITLSTHPYGCRVIQRVLEHCEDPNTQSKVMDEILGSVSMLAQDQYGNYVVQHVLEHGKPHERSTIIKELAGKIVQMSQQKFASNVVEKCLSFGGPNERELLVNEMLGTTDENEPLQAMMKDQFANYVVQKVLEICSDEQRELIMSRIKVHLSALKKYTYGKHIVARVEKLLTAGERRAGMSQNAAMA